MDISEVIRRWQAGGSRRRIASGTGLSRETVGKYIALAEGMGVSREGPGPTEGAARPSGGNQPPRAAARGCAHRGQTGSLGRPDLPVAHRRPPSTYPSSGVAGAAGLPSAQGTRGLASCALRNVRRPSGAEPCRPKPEGCYCGNAATISSKHSELRGTSPANTSAMLCDALRSTTLISSLDGFDGPLQFPLRVAEPVSAPDAMQFPAEAAQHLFPQAVSVPGRTRTVI